jgi:RNA polymerase sigma factor (TIGR02999 family)
MDERANTPANRLFELLYDELRSRAHAQLLRNGDRRMLNTTTLVHESYLRFLEAGRVQVEDQRHFLAYASHVMRSIVVDHARSQLAAKRGSGESALTLNTDIASSVAASDEQVLKVHDALEELAAVDARMAQVVEMRYFGGLSEGEIAGAMQISERTVQRLMEKARMLLTLALTSTG